jgi:hypothetical protein
MMIVCGALFFVAGAIRSPWAFWIPFAALLVGVAAITVFSYFVWRADPDKIPPAGTTPASGS